MTSKQELMSTIRQFITSQFPLARNQEFEDHTSLIDQGIIDSMGILEIVMFIESEFSVTLSDDEVISDNFHSVEALADFVSVKLTNAGHVAAEAE